MPGNPSRSIEDNYFCGNRNAGNIYEHNTYATTRDMLYQYNRIGLPVTAKQVIQNIVGNNNALASKTLRTIIKWKDSTNQHTGRDHFAAALMEKRA